MRRRTGIAVAVGLLLTAGAVSTGIASAHENPAERQSAAGKGGAAAGRGGMVFVQSNDPERNSILAFRRAVDGKLTAAGEYPTGAVAALRRTTRSTLSRRRSPSSSTARTT
jgi:hypothetical protein